MLPTTWVGTCVMERLEPWARRKSSAKKMNTVLFRVGGKTNTDAGLLLLLGIFSWFGTVSDFP
jgi:hypothetical protein